MRYRKKPVEIEAVQLRWSNWEEVAVFIGLGRGNDKVSPARSIEAEDASDTCGEESPYIALNVTTTHGDTAVVRHGDWIIPDSTPGTFYPVKPDVFEATYEPVPEP